MTTPSNIRVPADLIRVEKIMYEASQNKYDNRSNIISLIFDKDCLTFNTQNISGINFKNSNFNCGNFRGSDIKNITFINCDLDNSDFSGSKLGNVLFDHCDISHSTFQGSSLEQVKFIYTTGVNMNMKDCCLVNKTIIINSKFSDTNFSGCRFVESFFENSNLSECIFSDVEFVGSSGFIGSNLKEVNLSGSSGLLDPIDYLFDEFEWDKNEYGMHDVIVYCVFDDDQYNNIRGYMDISVLIDKNSILKDEVNFDRSDPFGCGIQVGNKKYIRSKLSNKGNFSKDRLNIWKGKIILEWLPGVVVPYVPMCHMIRTSRLMLLEQLDYTYFK